MYSPDDKIILAPDQSIFDLASGDFARQVLIISRSEPEAAVNNRNFLTKVLSAVQLSLDRDALFVELPVGQPVSLVMDVRRKKPQAVLVFGISAPQLGLHLHLSPYQPLDFQQMTLLFADALSDLEQDKEKKGLLWTALKTMFL
ncbi:MAG: hypothetical protein ABIO24_07500 [Saprospiraceae bacterium]